MPIIKKKVVVALSGGIDSSVAAALLKKAGFDLVGIFMRFWQDPFAKKWNRCCSPEAEKRARLIASNLSIPFYSLNLEKEFKIRIVDYFLEEHRAGRTPNPCVVCNKEIKFGLLLEKALALGADYVATGHYARLRREVLNHSEFLNYRYKLLMAKDKEKDQSYFLWMLNQKQLRRILFPIGNLTKNQVRNLAKKFDLPVLNIPESQEICFVETTVNDFLKKHFKKIKRGKIINSRGEILGEHFGLPFYTIGQRKGIGLTGGPYYVLDKNLEKNSLVVTKNEKELLKRGLIAENVNWISGREPKLPLKIKAKIRYRHKAATVIISRSLGSKIYSLKFSVPQKAITPGQSVVFYEGEELLGGGVIKV